MVVNQPAQGNQSFVIRGRVGAIVAWLTMDTDAAFFASDGSQIDGFTDFGLPRGDEIHDIERVEFARPPPLHVFFQSASAAGHLRLNGYTLDRFRSEVDEQGVL